MADDDVSPYTTDILIPADGSLPEGWDMDRLTMVVTSQIAALAAQNDRRVVPDALAHQTSVRPSPDDPALAIATWQVDTTPIQYAAVVNAYSYAAAPTDADPNVWAVTLDPLGAEAVVSVTHGLDSENVVIRAWDTDGNEDTRLAAFPISPTEVEVAALPSSARITIEPGPPPVVEDATA